MIDIALGEDGDILLNEKGDIVIQDSIRQEIRIKLLWFLNGWRWDEDEGIPYYDYLLNKSPDIYIIESVIREKVFDIDGIVAVRDVSIKINEAERKCRIEVVAETDFETLRDEVSIEWESTE